MSGCAFAVPLAAKLSRFDTPGRQVRSFNGLCLLFLNAFAIGMDFAKLSRGIYAMSDHNLARGCNRVGTAVCLPRAPVVARQFDRAASQAAAL